VLFLANRPFLPRAPLSLSVLVQEIPLGSTNAASPLTFTCPVSAAPGFLGDVA
jgi:hypothetical protein